MTSTARLTVPASFSLAHLEAACKALAATQYGLTGSEIGDLLAQCHIEDVAPNSTKWWRLYSALNCHSDASYVFAAMVHFIRQAMDPVRFVDNRDKFESIREHLNRALRFLGLEVDMSGALTEVEATTNLMDAEARAEDLTTSLDQRGIHPDVLDFCRDEWLNEDYVHASFEATKSIFDKIRAMSGLDGDGSRLVNQVFLGNSPLLAINDRSSESEMAEQLGFADLIKGAYGMFRNPTAHEARINWHISKEDAEDLLSLASLIHRRLDRSSQINRN